MRSSGSTHIRKEMPQEQVPCEPQGTSARSKSPHCVCPPSLRCSRNQHCGSLSGREGAGDALCIAPGGHHFCLLHNILLPPGVSPSPPKPSPCPFGPFQHTEHKYALPLKSSQHPNRLCLFNRSTLKLIQVGSCLLTSPKACEGTRLALPICHHQQLCT